MRIVLKQRDVWSKMLSGRALPTAGSGALSQQRTWYCQWGIQASA